MSAQEFQLDWFTLAGGGSLSSGGNYSLVGNIGQSAVNMISGGDYSIDGGFWSGVFVLSRLSIRFGSANTIILSWLNLSIVFVLQQTANMNAPGGGWTDVAQTPVVNGFNKQVTLPATGRFCLFRLVLP